VSTTNATIHDKDCELQGGWFGCNCADRNALKTGLLPDSAIKAAKAVTEFVNSLPKNPEGPHHRIEGRQFKLASIIAECFGQY
jgi:hypothetical protein